MNILMLGGTGYLGRKLTKKLAKKHHIVWITRNKGADSQGSAEIWEIDELGERLHSGKATYDALVIACCKYLVPGVSYQQIAEANLMNPIKVMEICLEAGVKRVLSIGTSLPEDLNGYAFTKRLFSKYGEYCCLRAEGNLLFCDICLENFYGEDEPGDRFLSKTVELLKKNQPVRLTDGVQRRDFIYIADVVDGMAYLIEHFRERGYQAIPLGSGDSPSIREVAEYLKELLQSSSELQFGKLQKRKHEPSTLADREEMGRYGLHPKISWREGLKNYLRKGESGHGG